MQKVLLVDDDPTLLQAMGDFLEDALKVHCVLLSGLTEVAANKAEVLGHDVSLAVIDINLGPGKPTGIDVYHWLSDHDFAGKCIFLTGHAKGHPLVKDANIMKGVSVYEKPMEVEKLLHLVEKHHGAKKA